MPFRHDCLLWLRSGGDIGYRAVQAAKNHECLRHRCQIFSQPKEGRLIALCARSGDLRIGSAPPIGSLQLRKRFCLPPLLLPPLVPSHSPVPMRWSRREWVQCESVQRLGKLQRWGIPGFTVSTISCTTVKAVVLSVVTRTSTSMSCETHEVYFSFMFDEVAQRLYYYLYYVSHPIMIHLSCMRPVVVVDGRCTWRGVWTSVMCRVCACAARYARGAARREGSHTLTTIHTHTYATCWLSLLDDSFTFLLHVGSRNVCAALGAPTPHAPHPQR